MSVKRSTEGIPLDPHIVPLIEMLLSEFNAKRGPFEEARARLTEACTRAVIAAGLKPEECEINWDLKAFVPRKK